MVAKFAHGVTKSGEMPVRTAHGINRLPIWHPRRNLVRVELYNHRNKNN